MVTPRNLRNAPITEALVDIRVKLPPSVGIDTLRSLHELISNEYPHERKRRRFEGLLEFKDESLKQTTLDQIDGYVYVSGDNKQIVQFRLDGFTFNRLKPYHTWEHLRDEAHRLWGLYVNVASPEIITRVALRYINHLEIPYSSIETSDYLTAPPTVPKSLPQNIINFLTRTTIAEPSMQAIAIITQAFPAYALLLASPIQPLAFEGSKTGIIIPIILDIDVFKEAQFTIDGKDAWETLEELREFKNKIFFESITEKTVELYL